MKALVATAALSLSLLAAFPAFGKDLAMVLDFKGKQDRAVHDRVVKAIKKAGVTVTPAGGGKQPKDEAARKTVGKKKGVTLFVEGEVSVSKKGVWALALASHGTGSGGEGDLSLEAKSLAGLFKKIDADVPDFVRSEIASTSAAPEPEPEPEAKKEPEPEAEPEEQPKKKHTKKHQEEDEGEKEDKEEKEEKEEKPAKHGARPSPLSLSAGMRLFSRHLSYNQDVNGNLRPYDLGAAPAVIAGLAWYPGAHFTGGPGAHVGIVGDFEQSLGAKSVLDASGAKYGTSMQAFSVGLRGRFPLGAHELGLSGRYGRHAFTIDGDADPSATSATGAPVKRDLVPDVKYSYLEPALDLRLGFGSLGISALVGYRIVVSAGDLESRVWFPAAKASALHAGLTVSYELVKSLSAFVGIDVRRYGLSMHSKPADLDRGQDVAGGAVDQYLAAQLGLVFELPGG